MVAPLIPPAKRGGNKRTVNMREVVKVLDRLRTHQYSRRWTSPGFSMTP